MPSMTTPFEPLGDAGAASPRPAASSTTDPKRPATMGELFAALSTQVTALVNGEIELTKLKAKNFAKKAGMGGALLSVAGVLALYMLGWALHTIELAIALTLPAWAASLIVAGVLLIIVAILAAVGTNELKKSQEHTPDFTSGFSQDIDAVKKGLGK